MYRIEKNGQIADKIYEMWVNAPHVAHHAQAGQFVIFRIDEKGERIPLTISAVDGDAIRVIYMAIGKTTSHLSTLAAGDRIQDVAGPLGKPSDIKKYGGPDSRVFLSRHWGIEQTRMPQPYQVRLAHQLIQAGAEAIIGHHPHWPQGIEVYRNRPIIYSLGNYVNGFCNEIEQDNIFAALHYSRGRMTHVEIIPLAGKNREIRFQPHVLKGKEAHEHLKYMDSLSRPLGTRIIIEKDRGYIKIR